MDINIIRSLVTIVLFVLFILLIIKVFSKKKKHLYEDAANLIFSDGDERCQQVDSERLKVNSHD